MQIKLCNNTLLKYMQSPSKQCDIDPVPTWLVKTCCDLLAPTITEMAAICLQQRIFPDSHKHALVRPRLKKPSLDPLDIKSFRPISNLSFLSKVAERLFMHRLNKTSICIICCLFSNCLIDNTIPPRLLLL